jgi:hypothetical protein
MKSYKFSFKTFNESDNLHYGFITTKYDDSLPPIIVSDTDKIRYYTAFCINRFIADTSFSRSSIFRLIEKPPRIYECDIILYDVSADTHHEPYDEELHDLYVYCGNDQSQDDYFVFNEKRTLFFADFSR